MCDMWEPWTTKYVDRAAANVNADNNWKERPKLITDIKATCVYHK